LMPAAAQTAGPARQKGQTTDASVVGADDGRGTATKRVGERPARFDPTIS
jgi:hypothetical protein